MSTQPRPRPRPKPKAKVSEAAASSSKAVEVDNDAMFMRNAGRDFGTWKKLEQINKEKKVQGSDDESEFAESLRKRGKKKDAVPSWQKGKAKVFTVDLTSDSDDEDVVLLGIENTLKMKRKRDERQRSRSRSITPPPEIPQHQLQNARNVVRRALAPKSREASPTLDDFNDISIDTIVLDPELDRIARQSTAAYKSSSLVHAGSSTETIEITVKWQPHPENENGKSETSVFKMNRTDEFRELFEAMADQESIPVDKLILTYRNMRLFPSVTPHTLDIWGVAEFLACNKATFDYMRSKAMLPKHVTENKDDPNGALLVISDDEDFGGAASRTASLAPEDDDGPDDKLKLKLKSALTDGEISLTVRPTTTCGAIVKAFLKKAGLADKYPQFMGGPSPKKKAKKSGPPKDPRLCIDGDKMDSATEIGEMDLEDGDLVDVVGL